MKSAELDQLWTTAKIFAGEGTSEAASSATLATPEEASRRPSNLAEKSLAHDRCIEPCTFRIVSAWELANALAVLRLALEHAHRADGHTDIEEIVNEFAERAARDGAYESPNGHGIDFWTRRVIWDVRGTQEAVQYRNLNSLDQFVQRIGGFLAHDQRQLLYERLLGLAKRAAEAPALTAANQKKLRRDATTSLLAQEVQRCPTSGGAGAGGPSLASQARDGWLTAAYDRLGLGSARAISSGDSHTPILERERARADRRR